MTALTRAADLRFWLITLAAIVAMLVTASLGRWQLSRASQKQALQSAIDERRQLGPVDVRAFVQAQEPSASTTGHADKAGADDALAHGLVHRTVALRGRWVPEFTVFLDNRQMNGRPGFFVVTPLQLTGPEGAGKVVMVQRGWVPRNFQDRTQLPQVETPRDAEVSVQGRIASPPSRLYEFDDGPAIQRSSPIRQNLDLAAFRTESRLPILPLTVLQTGEAADGLLRNWPIVSAGIDKHYGYAFQWFGLCGLIATLYVWFNIFRRFIRPRRQPAA
ncbi:SURF1 family protein [Acidovorax sp. BL-A-41-H1]|uniref:SURF1 family protein n=1 Tax=Acidovorax sp. BL-A-41-H1 TaxID=3421102 RepID=UPI003F7AB9DD